MSLNVKKVTSGGTTGPKQDPIEAGTYPARVVQVIDLGLQSQRPYQGQEKPPAHMIRLTYELVDEFCLDENGEVLEDKPRWLSEDFNFYGLQAERAKSTLRYKAIDPEDTNDGDFTGLIGMPCNVTVVTKPSKKDPTKIYNNVGGVTSVRARDVARMPELVNPPKVFLLDEPDMEVFGSLPEWLQDIIKSNLNYEGSVLKALVEGKGVAEPKAEAVPAEKAAPDNDEDPEGEGEGWV